MTYSYYDDNNNIRQFKLEYDQRGRLKTPHVENKSLNSIFARICGDDNSSTEDKEVCIARLFAIADKYLKSSNGNGVLDLTELEELKFAMDAAHVVDTNEESVITSGSYLYVSKEYNRIICIKGNFNKHPLDLSTLPKGKYYIIPKTKVDHFYNFCEEDPDYEIVRLQDEWGNGYDKSWSEGLDRQIGTIRISGSVNNRNGYGKQVLDEMTQLGNKYGFNVEVIEMSADWIEDYSVRRWDGKVLLPKYDYNFTTYADRKNISSRRKNISSGIQGSAARGLSSEYAKMVPLSDKVVGDSYIEGGNILNTIKKDGKPAAVIGQETIDYTLYALKKENPDATEELAIQVIAKDLGLAPEDITFIPQFDFHIDMAYRPLHDGQMAIPDYNLGIELLRKTTFSEPFETKKTELIQMLEELAEKSSNIINEAEENLKSDGYKVVRIPYFYLAGDDYQTINYMNGVGGTTQDGTSFYITNRSGIPELDEVMKKYIEENCQIDNVEFVSTQKFLKHSGGIDCLTQEVHNKFGI